MNRADIRQAIYDQIDWQPDTSEQAQAKVDRFINRAYLQLALDAPFLFFEDKEYFRTQPTVTSVKTITNDGLTQTAESGAGDSSEGVEHPGLVWERSYSITAAYAPTGDDASITEWPLDPEGYAGVVPHPWDGRWLEITDSTGQVHRRRIRHVWWKRTPSSPPVDTHTDYITLDRPLDLRSLATDASEYTKLDYRIYTQSYYLPADTIEVRSLRTYDDTRREPISLIYTEEAEEQWWDDIQGTSAAGSPRKAFRTDFFQMPTPTFQPTVSITQDGWDDADQQPFGGFEFFYTICWGTKDIDRTSIGDIALSGKVHRFPRFESAPSPVSPLAIVDSATQSIEVQLPNFGAKFGFAHDSSNNIEKGKSGFWKRIYARRVNTNRAIKTSQAQIGDSSDFFFVGATSGSDETFLFNGQLINSNEPYRQTHGYSGIQLSPMPDAEYDVDVRYLRKPQPLNHDQAVPRIPPEAIDVIVQKTLATLYESLGSPELSVMAQTKYQASLVTLSKRYGSLPTGVFRKRLGRSRGHGRRGYRFLVEER
jgi:hypothetical protein|tara:strand:+ start:1052 stop:2662 length:1611 start_codon:yes stop_codon:yes gene_type:complete